MKNRRKEATDLAAKNGILLLAPLLGPTIRIGKAVRSNQRGREQVSHDGIVGSVTFGR